MPPAAGPTAEAQRRAWAASGAMALTGRADGPPLGPPLGLVPKLAAVGDRVGLELDPLALLGERAALRGLTRRGTTSCGGGARLLRAADGWVALSLARPSDLDLLPAWLGVDPVPPAAGGPDAAATNAAWALVAASVARRPAGEVLAAAEGLGLPLAAVPADGPEMSAEAPTADLPVAWHAPGRRSAAGPPPRGTVEGLLVVDLTALWAGPLCGALLADLGAEVVKVESTSRPDGARAGEPAFFDLVNAGKRAVALDLTAAEGRGALGDLLRRADVVLEGSRPRALQAMGIDAEALLAGGGPRAWISVTAHGRAEPGARRVGFGDDAAAAGGLLAWEDGDPRFCADAVADPVTGLVAAAVVVEAVGRGGRWLVDVAMARVARHLAGPTVPAAPATPDDGLVAAAPRARCRGAARPLGADTAAVLGALR